MMILREGEKKDVAVQVERTRSTGDIGLTVPEYRILDVNRAVLVDWAMATFNGTTDELYALFDATLEDLCPVGTYYVQLRGVIGAERYQASDVVVVVRESGP